MATACMEICVLFPKQQISEPSIFDLEAKSFLGFKNGAWKPEAKDQLCVNTRNIQG